VSAQSMVGLVNFAKDPGSVELRDLPVPEIGEEDVLLSVDSVGICGSDLHQYHGSQSWKVNYPVVLGHEFAGVIAKAGKRVSEFKEGDRVVSETAAVLPRDSALIRRGLYNLSRATGQGIMVAALTTILGFGTLMISNHRGIKSLGLALSLGVTCCMLTALVFLPALLRLKSLRRAERPAADAAPSRHAA